MPPQNVAHRLVRHPVSQIAQGSYDPVVSPSGVLSHQSNHQVLYLRAEARSASGPTLFRAVELMRDEPAILGEDGSGLATQATCCSAFLLSRLPSRVTLKPANGGQGKTGQRKWLGTQLFYPAASWGGKSNLVRQLRGPHFRTYP